MRRRAADGLVTAFRHRPRHSRCRLCAGPVRRCGRQGVGAAHGGWRGALGGIVEATLDRMEALGAKRARIRAGIGPCIAQTSYEVGPEFPQPFLVEDPASAAYFAPAARTGHFMFDLPGYIERRLARAGSGIERAAHDTVAEDTHFFSYRRACLRGEPVYGRALSAIALRD